MSELLTVQGLTAAFFNKKHRTEVLHGISFSIEEGEILALLEKVVQGRV